VRLNWQRLVIFTLVERLPHISKFNPWNLFLHSRMINLMLFIPLKLWSTLVEVDLVNFAIFFNPSLAIYFKMLNGIRVLFLKLFCGEIFNIRSKRVIQVLFREVKNKLDCF
jgi:hypothetical protein